MIAFSEHTVLTITLLGCISLQFYFTLNTVTTSKTMVTVKKLNAKKTYYVKVRAYKLIDGKVTYGAYSKAKKVS